MTEHDYPHALVRLHWCKVRDWTGDFEMREGQAMAWQQLPLTVAPVLPGACRCWSGSRKSAGWRSREALTLTLA